MTDLMLKYPAVADLHKAAGKRLPHIAWEYLETGTTHEQAVQRNIDQFKKVTILPRFVKGHFDPDVSTSLFGQNYAAPFGVAPIGMSGLIWPEMECIMARAAAKHQIPYTLSTVAAETPETVGPHAGEMGWFQLYAPRDKTLRDDILNRARSSGFKTLVVTADTPAPSQRERLKRAGFQMPPALTPRFIWQGVTHPAWSMATLKRGLPKLRTMEKYTDSGQMATLANFVRKKLNGTLSWDYLKEVRDQWDGPMILKGIMHPADAELAIGIGFDGIQVSNHGGRQFDGVPASIDMLADISAVCQGKAAVLFDSGVRSGLDVLRALALGADFVLMGRPFMYGVGALGEAGGAHVIQLLINDLKTNMSQVGAQNIAEVKALELGP
ncbi:MAG: alpha-hydroxy acid oxidase [Anaerolineae bacterium]